MKIVSELLERLCACDDRLTFARDWPDGWVPNRSEAIAAWDKYDWNWAAENLLPAYLFPHYETARAAAKEQYIGARRTLNSRRKAGEFGWPEFDAKSDGLRKEYRLALAGAFGELMAKEDVS